MPPKRPIEGSGDAEAAEAPEHGVDMETEVVVTAGELSLRSDVIDSIELPQPEAEFPTDSDDHSDNDSDDHSGDDSDDHAGDDSENVG